jgi:hypothetical protein
MSSPHWQFGPFRLDSDNACLWHDAQALPLTPKAFGVLHYLVAHPDRLVTKDALFEALWPETAVSDAALRVCIGELRKALGETAHTPHYIATVTAAAIASSPRSPRSLRPSRPTGSIPRRAPGQERRPRPTRPRPGLPGRWSAARRFSIACRRPWRRPGRGCAT